MKARKRLRPQAKNLPQSVREFLTPQFFKQVRRQLAIQRAASGGTGSQFFGARGLDGNRCFPVGREPGSARSRRGWAWELDWEAGHRWGSDDAVMKKRLGAEWGLHSET